MTAMDFVKVFAVAAAILVVNVAISFAVVAAYAALDLGILLAAGALTAFAPIVALSLASKLGGVWAAGR